MSFGNEITIVGNVTKDPEIRFTKGGSAVCSLSIAYNHKHLNKNTNEWEEEVSFFDVTCWATLAENVGDSIQKGDRVVVIGRLEQETWDDKDTGAARSRVKIVAEEVSPSLRWVTCDITKNERDDHNKKDKPSTGRGGSSRRGHAAGEEPF